MAQRDSDGEGSLPDRQRHSLRCSLAQTPLTSLKPTNHNTIIIFIIKTTWL